jgi:hypothetical protein
MAVWGKNYAKLRGALPFKYAGYASLAGSHGCSPSPSADHDDDNKNYKNSHAIVSVTFFVVKAA